MIASQAALAADMVVVYARVHQRRGRIA